MSLWRHRRPCCPARPYFWTSAGETAFATTPSTGALGVCSSSCTSGITIGLGMDPAGNHFEMLQQPQH